MALIISLLLCFLLSVPFWLVSSELGSVFFIRILWVYFQYLSIVVVHLLSSLQRIYTEDAFKVGNPTKIKKSFSNQVFNGVQCPIFLMASTMWFWEIVLKFWVLSVFVVFLSSCDWISLLKNTTGFVNSCKVICFYSKLKYLNKPVNFWALSLCIVSVNFFQLGSCKERWHLLSSNQDPLFTLVLFLA